MTGIVTLATSKQWQQVARRIVPNSKLIRSWSLARGPVMKVTALEIEDADGQTVRVVIRHPDQSTEGPVSHTIATEFHVMRHLHALGLPVSEPYVLDESGEILSYPYMALEYIEGGLNFDPAPVNDAMVQLADCAARIHSVDVAKLDLGFLPRQHARVAQMLDNPPEEPDAFAQEARVREILRAVWPLPSRNAHGLLHGDLWPDNVLWKEGRLAAVIDWEDAALGDPLADLAISRLDILCAYGRDAMLTFTNRYRERMPAADFDLLGYWDLCAALRLGPNISGWAYDDEHEQALRTGYTQFLAQALDAVADR